MIVRQILLFSTLVNVPRKVWRIWIIGCKRVKKKRRRRRRRRRRLLVYFFLFIHLPSICLLLRLSVQLCIYAVLMVKFPQSPIIHHAYSSWIKKTIAKTIIVFGIKALFDNSIGLYGNLTALIYICFLCLCICLSLKLCLHVTPIFISSSVPLICDLFDCLSICDSLSVYSASVYRSISVDQSVSDCLFVHLSLLISLSPSNFLPLKGLA